MIHNDQPPNTTRLSISFSRISEKQQGNTFDSSTLSSREDRIKIDPVVHLKQVIAELQEENAGLRADLVFRQKEFQRRVEEIKRESLEKGRGRGEDLNDENLNLGRLLQCQDMELEALKELLRGRDREVQLKAVEIERLQQTIQRVNQEKQTILCLFKKFQNKDVYQMIRDLSCCQQLMYSNIKSLVQSQQKSSLNTFKSMIQHQHQHNLTFRTTNLLNSQSHTLQDLEEQLETFKKNLLTNTNKHFKNKRPLLESFVTRLDSPLEESVLDQTHNVCARRVKRLKVVIIKLLNIVAVVPGLKSELTKITTEVDKIGKTLARQYEEMFQKAVDSIQRYAVNTQPAQPKPQQPKKRAKSKLA